MKTYGTTIVRGILLVVIWQTYALTSLAQIAPYTIPPRWMFGYQGGMNFPGLTGAPVVLAGNPTTNAIAPALENSSTISDPSGAIAFYTNGVRIYNGANAVVRDMNTTDAIAANSSTGTAIIVPDPSAPATQYYLFIANDLTAGLRPGKGIYYYRLRIGTGVIGGPTNIAGGSQVDESLAAGSDGAGGYWVVSHGMDNTFWKWHVTAAGVSGVTTLSHTPYVGGTGIGTIKFSRCQNKIAYTGNNSLVVYNWDKTAGTISSSAIYSNVLGMGATGTNPTYGLEFSPDGNMVYHSLLGEVAGSIGGRLRQLNLSTGTFTTLSTISSNGGYEIGTMQLGPDGKIYVTNAVPVGGTTGNIYVGVVNNPNTAGTGSNYSGTAFLLKPSNGSTDPSTFRGLANEAWMSPEQTVLNISGASGCTKSFSITFETYFNQAISLDNSSIEWDFGDGVWRTGLGATPTFDYSTIQTGGPVTRTVRTRFNDQVCNEEWTSTNTVAISCPLPVTWLDFDGTYENRKVKLNWSTAREFNNEYFSVERSSDGIHFTSVGRVEGKGNSNSVQEYSFIDENIVGGGVYYRIAQYDIDGQFERSKTIFVETSDLFAQVLPNPASDGFNLYTNSTSAVTIFVRDALGRIVYEKELPQGEQHLFFGAYFPDGNYILQTISSSDSYIERLVKK